MPNWCYNSLTVYGSDEFLDPFRDKIDEMGQAAHEGRFIGGLFEALCPIPNVDDKNWYEKRLNNWGTKWDVGFNEIELNDDKNMRQLRFDTAWSPPFDFLLSVSMDYPALRFDLHYREDGMGFGGHAIFLQGWFVNEEVDYSTVEFPDDAVPGESQWDEIMEQIDLKLEAAEFDAEEKFLRELLLRGEMFDYE